MNKLIIKRDGLRLLERIARSCVPTPTNGGMIKRDYLFGLQQKRENITYDDFMKGFPLGSFLPGFYNLYEHIKTIAGEQGVQYVDEKFIAEFFGGDPHIKRAEQDIKEEKIAKIMGESYARRDYLSHVLLVLEITGRNGSYFHGKYVNGNIGFQVKNLVPFPEEKNNIAFGDKVLSHYASIILSVGDAEIGKDILKMQAENRHFMKAAWLVSQSGIDHKKMLHIRWAEKVAEMNK